LWLASLALDIAERILAGRQSACAAVASGTPER
jgi:hypothetical protein